MHFIYGKQNSALAFYRKKTAFLGGKHSAPKLRGIDLLISKK